MASPAGGCRLSRGPEGSLQQGAARIGVFGGSFNPPHLAHLALARLARDTLALDELRWMPAGRPWQKSPAQLADGPHRAAMVQTLIEGEPRMAVDRRELARPTPSYTVDSLRELRQEWPGSTLYLILGADQFARLDTWREADALADLAVFAVAVRAGLAARPPAAWQGRRVRVEQLALPPMAISSTDIRLRLARAQPVSPLVGAAVAGYIDQHRLYRAPPGS